MKHWNWNESEARACSRAQRKARAQTKLALGAVIAGKVLGIAPMNALAMAEENGESGERAKRLPDELSFLEGLV